MTQPAVSTVAMTLYNYINAGGLPVTAAAIMAHPAVQEQHPCSDGTMVIALEELVRRGYLFASIVDDGRRFLASADPRGRLAVKRDRSDPTGWAGWEVLDGRVRIPIDLAIGKEVTP